MPIGSPVNIPRCIRFSRRLIVTATLAIWIALLCAACGRGARDQTPVPAAPAASGTAPATPAAMPTAASLLPTVTPRPLPTTGPTTFTSPRYGYTVALPCCWVGLPSPSAALEAALADLLQTPAPEQTPSQRPSEQVTRLATQALELVAILPDVEGGGAPLAQLTVSVLPSGGLTLEQYLESAAAALNRIANTEVQESRLDPALHPEQLPAAVIEYRSEAARAIAGLQVAYYLPQLNESAQPAYLLVLTFTTAEPLYSELAPSFAEIARQVALSQPA